MLRGGVVLYAAAAVLVAICGLCGFFLFSFGRWATYHRFKGLERPPSEPAALARYLRLEIGSFFRLGWWVVIASHRDGWLAADGPERGPPVLCIHGITQAGSNFWGLRRELARRGRRSRAVSYGRVRTNLVAHVPPVERVLREMTAQGPIDVVAHSMGGVVLRLALARNPELGANVRRVITLGSPHFGTAAGRGFRFVPTVRALGRRSTDLAELPHFPEHARVTTFSARQDLVVYPVQTCHVPGARTIDLAEVGHTGLLTNPAVIDQVADAVCEEEEGR